MTNCLIYYADQDCYEGSDRPFAVTHSEERAKEIVAEIVAHGKKIADQMLYPYEALISNDEWRFRETHNQKLFDQEWPYNWEASLSSDFDMAPSGMEGEPIGMIFDENTVAYKGLLVL